MGGGHLTVQAALSLWIDNDVGRSSAPSGVTGLLCHLTKMPRFRFGLESG